MESDQTTFTIPSAHQTVEQTVWTACLVVVRGVGTGNKILLNRPRTSIGRADDADVRLAKAGVSRQHAVIVPVEGERFRIEDQGSTNGTYVNGQRIESTILQEQDLIAIGESRLKFIAANSPDQPYYEELYCQAQLDKALQVYNKHYFLTRLEDELRRHQRAGAPLSLILFDVDHFKRLNDSYGHLAGDAALVHLCELTKQSLRESDVLCRYGGEEFAIILGQTEAATALAIAEEIRERVATTPVEHADSSIAMTISLGISNVSAATPKATAEALIVQADRALYAAKHAGRNRALVFEPARMEGD